MMLLASSLASLSTVAAQTGTVEVRNGAGVVTAVSTGTLVTSDDGGDDDTAGGGSGGGGSTGGATEWPWTCEFYSGVTLEDLGVTTTSPRPGSYYHLLCSVNPSHIGIVEPINDPVYQYNPAMPIPGQPNVITSIQVREQAQDLAVPTALAPALSPDGRQITGVETWFWPEGSTDTVARSATAGGLTVTVEARYVETTFTLGAPNAATLTCDTFVVWTPGATDSPCTHEFFEETANQTVAAASRWDFYWFDNAAQPTPVLYGTVTNIEANAVEVIDLEAVISRK